MRVLCAGCSWRVLTCRHPIPKCVVCGVARRAKTRKTTAPQPLFWIGGEQRGLDTSGSAAAEDVL